MFFGRCRGCEAHKQEINHLMGQLQELNHMLTKAHARVVEIASPGANGRAALAERTPAPEPPRQPAQEIPTFPGYPPHRPRPNIVAE